MTTGDRTDFTAVVDYLFGLKPRGSKLGIDRMRPFAAALGNPERSLPCIHIAGTNGKGSVAAMLESILRTAGWKVGLYTSPHLVHLGERVQVNRQPLTNEKIIEYALHLDMIADSLAVGENEENRPSFFEYMTAMALLEFRRTECDIAILEVGLGGEFDATNIVVPEASAITSIGLDHCEWLGESIAKIARAKAGIIKPGRPVVIGRLPGEAERVVRETANAEGARVVSVREAFGEAVAGYPMTNLEGDYQRTNAATATLVAGCLDERWRMTAKIITKGLQAVDWSGRWQRTRIGGRLALLDVSHNEEGAGVLDANLRTLVAETGQAPIVIVGVLGVERAGPLLAAICRHAKDVYLVVPEQLRAVSWEVLETFIPEDYEGSTKRGTVAGIFPGGDVCRVGEPGDTVVVTGSIYLLGEVMQRLGKTGVEG